MGLYRTGKFWAIEHFDVEPDIIVFGKALTNGLNPLSGVWARESLIAPDVFPPGSTHSTFAANTLGTAVALETLRLAAEGDLEGEVSRKGARFLERLRELHRQFPRVIGDVDGLGLALRVELCHADGRTPDRDLADRIFREALRGNLVAKGRPIGLVLDIGGYFKNVFTLAPCFEITDAEIDLAVDLLEQLIRRCAPDRI